MIMISFPCAIQLYIVCGLSSVKVAIIVTCKDCKDPVAIS